MHTKETRILGSIGVMTWLILHWQFTAYYQQTACLFRITFSQRTSTDCERVSSRKAKLEALEYVVFLLILSFLAYLITGAVMNEGIYWNIS